MKTDLIKTDVYSKVFILVEFRALCNICCGPLAPHKVQWRPLTVTFYFLKPANLFDDRGFIQWVSFSCDCPLRCGTEGYLKSEHEALQRRNIPFLTCHILQILDHGFHQVLMTSHLTRQLPLYFANLPLLKHHGLYSSHKNIGPLCERYKRGFCRLEINSTTVR